MKRLFLIACIAFNTLLVASALDKMLQGPSQSLKTLTFDDNRFTGTQQNNTDDSVLDDANTTTDDDSQNTGSIPFTALQSAAPTADTSTPSTSMPMTSVTPAQIDGTGTMQMTDLTQNTAPAPTTQTISIVSNQLQECDISIKFTDGTTQNQHIDASSAQNQSTKKGALLALFDSLRATLSIPADKNLQSITITLPKYDPFIIDNKIQIDHRKKQTSIPGVPEFTTTISNSDITQNNIIDYLNASHTSISINIASGMLTISRPSSTLVTMSHRIQQKYASKTSFTVKNNFIAGQHTPTIKVHTAYSTPRKPAYTTTLKALQEKTISVPGPVTYITISGYNNDIKISDTSRSVYFSFDSAHIDIDGITVKAQPKVVANMTNNSDGKIYRFRER